MHILPMSLPFSCAFKYLRPHRHLQVSVCRVCFSSSFSPFLAQPFLLHSVRCRRRKKEGKRKTLEMEDLSCKRRNQKKQALLLLCFSFCGFLLSIPKAQGARVGGIADIPDFQHNKEVQDLARFAVDEYNKQQSARLEFLELTKAQSQVVAGTLYYLTIKAQNANQRSLYLAKVWVKPWQNFKQLKDFQPL